MDETILMSPEINEISAALSSFQGAIRQPEIEKGRTVKVSTKGGAAYTFKYVDLSQCMKAAAPLLKANGLAVTQLISNGKLVTILAHKSGQWFKSETPIGTPQNYQALGSAITYLKRYSFCAILGIVADSDDDGNAAMGNSFKDVGAISKAVLMELDAANSREDVMNIYARYKDVLPVEYFSKGEVFEAFSKKYKSYGTAHT